MTGKKSIKLPDYREKQRLLYGDKVQPELVRKTAKNLLAAGALNDAAEFFHRVEDSKALEAIAEQALEEGDLFLFDKVYRQLGRQPTPELYDRLGQRALATGKLQFAAQAFTKAGNDAMVKQVQQTEETHT